MLKFLRRRAVPVEPEEVVTTEVNMEPDMQPVEPRRVEKITTVDGREFVLFQPRQSHFVDGGLGVYGTVVEGNVITQRTMRIPLSIVASRVAMGWSHQLVAYVEMPGAPLPSVF